VRVELRESLVAAKATSAEKAKVRRFVRTKAQRLVKTE
jgi:hypothetical protein